MNATTLVTSSPGVAIPTAMSVGSVFAIVGAASEVERKVATRRAKAMSTILNVLQEPLLSDCHIR